MVVDIPGYYYDSEKKKYFKIEKSHTAPASAAWSSDEVKRRKVQDQVRQTKQRRADRLKHYIKRNHAIQRHVVSSDIFSSQVGSGLSSVVASYGPAHLRAAAWADGLADKGLIPFVPSFARSRFANMSCFYVSGDDTKTGMGAAYATLDEETLVGSYIDMDENDKVKFLGNSSSRPGHGLSFRTEMIRCPQISSIQYHKPSNKILLTSREVEPSCGIFCFSPLLSQPDDNRPFWLLGETEYYQRIPIRVGPRDEWLVNKSTPAPPSSDLLCVVGTNTGLLRVTSNETMAHISSHANNRSAAVGRGHFYKAGRQPKEIFDQDFLTGNHNVVLAGGRQPRVWITDLRVPEPQWSSIAHASSVAHLRSVNEHQVVVAGLRHSMALYDMRFFREECGPNGSSPLLQFHGYHNEAHFHTGWDVSTDLGVVAAAHDDGTVKLFSLASGRLLNQKGGALGGIRSQTPIKALMFQTMPRQTMPSLFIGEGPSLKKFSFGVDSLEDEA